ncbi:MAG: Uma2 family endonuclease [Chloroflexota bacterium]|nr:Uma2 family endonuclease [Chloroflexota bacterium]
MTVAAIEYVLHSPDASWCYDKWEHLPNDGNRYEVIDGVLYMSTAPSFWHQRTIMRLDRNVGLPLETQNVAIAVSAPIGLIMPGADPVQPDFMLIRSERRDIIAEDGRIRGVPDLISEVLSPNNPELDTVIKRAAYARAGVPEYWMLRPVTRDVRICWRPDQSSGDYAEERFVPSGSELVSPTLPIRVPVAMLFEDQP